MDEQEAKRGLPSRLVWILVILAIVVVWWLFKPAGSQHARDIAAD